MGETKKAYKILAGNPERKSLFGRPRRGWKIVLELTLGLEVVGWIHLALDRDQCRALVNTVMNLMVP
jgi:hypothetical protein